jgi:predicted GTPase
MQDAKTRRRIVIMGAAGRDFHNFNVVYRDDPEVEVVAFTATQIPGIAERRYPASLAGPFYPDGIPIVDEAELEVVCRSAAVNEVVFAYSDVSHAHVMHLASRSLAVGCDFTLLGPARTMLAAGKPVISITAVRTGCGKSQTARWLSRHLQALGLRVVVLRHPMPYGDLARQRVQRFASPADLDAAECTTEEREEYEPHIEAGCIVYAGVDYAAILAQAEDEADIILWDGGNNDFSFLRADLGIVMADALRPGQATAYHPGEATLRLADIVVVNKVDAAPPEQVAQVIAELHAVNPQAILVRAASPVSVADPEALRGRRVIVVEDGPTITHGGLPYGAGYSLAKALAAEVVDPRASAAPEIAALFARYPHIGAVLPNVGYLPEQLEALAATITDSEAEIVVNASPVDLGELIAVDQPIVRARYEYADAGRPSLGELVDAFLAARGVGGS